MSAGVNMFETAVSVTETGIFRLALAWEMEALALDAVRYRTHIQAECDTLRDRANVYRRCAAELTSRLKAGLQ